MVEFDSPTPTAIASPVDLVGTKLTIITTQEIDLVDTGINVAIIVINRVILLDNAADNACSLTTDNEIAAQSAVHKANQKNKDKQKYFPN